MVEGVPTWVVRKFNLGRGGGVDLKERRERIRKVDEDDNEIFMCNWRSAYEDKIHIVGECPRYKRESERERAISTRE